jgi:hypothetical protein
MKVDDEMHLLYWSHILAVPYPIKDATLPVRDAPDLGVADSAESALAFSSKTG